MIGHLVVVRLGLAQLVCWGVFYYLIGVFGDLIAADLGWSRAAAHGGFSAALLAMAALSPVTGSLIDAHGGRKVMALGAVLGAAACTAIAASHSLPAYYAAWLVLGVAMRFTLYDAAFATLARIAGPHARVPMSRITLLGGLASTVFWPVGHFLAELLGWRGALLAYAGIAVLTVPLFLTLPAGRYVHPAGDDAAGSAPPPRRGRQLAGGALYVLLISLCHALASAMSAHMIGILVGLGLAASSAVWASTFRGIGQVSSRLGDTFLGGRLHPLTLALVSAALLPVAFAIGLMAGGDLLTAMSFAFVYGAAHGIVSIVQGTVPLVLFDHRTYGAVVGRLLVPSFILSALSPFAYALVIERYGEHAALRLSLALGLAILAIAVSLKLLFMRSREAGAPRAAGRSRP